MSVYPRRNPGIFFAQSHRILGASCPYFSGLALASLLVEYQSGAGYKINATTTEQIMLVEKISLLFRNKETTKSGPKNIVLTAVATGVLALLNLLLVLYILYSESFRIFYLSR